MQFRTSLATPFLWLVFLTVAASAQDRLKLAPGYARYERVSRETSDSVKGGSISVSWNQGGASFEFSKEGKRFRYDLESRTAADITDEPKTSSGSAPATNSNARAGT